MTRSRLFDLVRLALLVLVVVAVGVALWRNWSAVAAHLSRISWPVLVAAFGLSMLAPILTLMGWRVLLADLGTDLAPAPAASVFLVGQLGKYVPGSVWSVLAQAEMGARLGVPRRRMGVAGLLSIGLSVITGCLVGLPAVPLLRGAGDGAFSPWWIVLAVVLGVVLLWPALLNRIVATGLRLLRREPLEHTLGGRAIVVTVVWFVGAWLAAGAAVFVLARSVAPDAALGSLSLTAICGFALASAIGMLSVLVPAGVGVRDGILALLLVGLMPLGAATAVVVVARFVTVLVDLAVAGLAWAWGRRHHLLGSSA